MQKHDPLTGRVSSRRIAGACRAATVLATLFASQVGAAPAGKSHFSLPITLSAPKSADPATQPSTPGFALPFDFSASKALEPTKLPTPEPKVAQAPETAPTPAPVTAPAPTQPAPAVAVSQPTVPVAPPATARVVAVAPTPATNPAPPVAAADEPNPDAVGFGATPRPTQAVRTKFNEKVLGIADPENTLDLVVGKPRILMLSQAPQKIQIPDEKVASYDVLSEKEVSVGGIAVGTTVLNIWFEDKDSPTGRTLLSYYVRVQPDPETKIRVDRLYQALEDTINKAFPDSHVKLTLVGRNLVVTGEAKDAHEASDIIRLLENNVVGTGQIQAPKPGFVGESPAADQGSPAAPAAGAATAAPTSAGEALALANNGIGGGAGAGNGHNNGGRGGSASDGFIINKLRVPGENQVMLRVTVAEVNRDAARSIGLNFTVSGRKGPVFANLTGGLGTFSPGAQGGQFPMLLDNGQIGVTVEALRSMSLAKSLAEPNLVTVNGQSASFNAGGKFPVPVVTGATASGLQGVQFIPYGISLNFTPYITEKDKIRLSFTAEVSTRDATTGVTVGNSVVSGIDTRNIQTTVDLRPGQTLAVAGLVQTNYAAGSQRIPFVGEMPGLANLLGTSQSSASEQELVILINAELVRPMKNKETPPVPGQNLYESNDADFFLKGKLEGDYPPDYRSAMRTDWERLTRYQRLQRAYLFGPTGYSDGRTGAEMPRGPIQAVSTPASDNSQ